MAKLFVSHVVAEDAAPSQWILVTHGIYGAGNNWRGIAKKLVARVPSWGAMLVDLRNHGRSERGEPPHTVDACATDVAELIAREATQGRSVRALSGHSFGGKVVLQARSFVPDLRAMWVHDASPSARPELWSSARSIIAILEWLRSRSSWPSRDAFIAEGAQFGDTVAQWLALNLEPRDEAWALRFDVDVTETLLRSYFATDAWPNVLGPGALHVVVGTRSESVPPAERVRLRAAGATVHELDAGHWVHVDQPDALVDLMATDLAQYV